MIEGSSGQTRAGGVTLQHRVQLRDVAVERSALFQKFAARLCKVLRHDGIDCHLVLLVVRTAAADVRQSTPPNGNKSTKTHPQRKVTTTRFASTSTGAEA